MTLTRLLEIKLSLLNFDEEPGLALAEQLWQGQGSPSEVRPLCDVLETILRRCKEEGILYPPILLLRKKGLERGSWSPRAKGPPNRESAPPKEGDPSCPKCRGTGHVVIEDGHGYCSKFCECKKSLAGQR